jgi:hypothetical protein
LEQLPTFKKKCDAAKTQFQAQQNLSTSLQSSPSKSDAKETATPQPNERMCLYAKMEANYHLSNKKALFWNMMNYYKR